MSTVKRAKRSSNPGCSHAHRRQPSAAASHVFICLCSELAGGQATCRPISCAGPLLPGPLVVDQLPPSLSSSVWPAVASMKDSARASTLVSTAAAAQAVVRGRARLAHHLPQPCSCHAVPASRQPAREQIARRSKFKRGLRFWKSWVPGLVKEGRRKKTTEQIMKMQARATGP